jgi:large subunit ribosomal protein L12
MEYIYSAMLLHAAGKKITPENIKKVLTAAGVKADDARVKALAASLEGVNIEEAIKTATPLPTPAAAAPAAAPAPEAAPSGETPAGDEKKEAKKAKKKEEPEVSEEEAAAGLGALFD